jgi:5-methylcytosine-specific restriction endonuclease McrA
MAALARYPPTARKLCLQSPADCAGKETSMRRNDGTQDAHIKQDLIEQLYKVTNGRPHALTRQLAHLTGHADQTIRKIHSQTGEFFGIRPLKLGGRLLWPLAEIAILLSSSNQAASHSQKKSRRSNSFSRQQTVPEANSGLRSPLTDVAGEGL